MLITITYALIAFIDIENLERIGWKVESCVILCMESLSIHRFCTLAWIAKGLDSSMVHLVHVLHVLLPQLLVCLDELLLVQPELVHLLLSWARVEDGTLSAHHVGLIAPSVLLLRIHVGLVLCLRWLVIDDASRKWL